MKSKVYTRTGDKGSTSLVGGARIAKNHIRLEAYGTIDELNSFLGLLRSQEIPVEDKETIFRIQNDLFLLGGVLATADEKYLYQNIEQSHIAWLEEKIDEIDANLPPLSRFVIPSGYQSTAICHVCRTICRRAERIICTLAETAAIPDTITVYVNRLSDFLFVLARRIDIKYHKEEFFSP
ncbi:cobalamin adenosyltransferase [Bacteroidia bacterium]|nr:cobalamin adenosyltransferase [Bacteroidia bacterium]